MTKRFHQVGLGVGGSTWFHTLTLNMSLGLKCLALFFLGILARMTFKFYFSEGIHCWHWRSSWVW